MGFAKRAFLSLVRRAGKTLILFLVILIVGNLIAGMVAMREAIGSSERLAKATLGASVSLGPDYQALEKAWNTGENPEVGALTADIIEQMGARPEVRSFDYSLDIGLTSTTLQNYQPDDYTGGSSASFVTAPDGRSYEVTTSYFSLRGIRYAPVMPIEEGKYNLVSGRVFTVAEIEEGKMVALVSERMAQTNNLHVGDTVVFNNEIRDWAQVVSVEPGSATVGSVEDQQGALVASRDAVFEIIGIFAPNATDENPDPDDYMAQILKSESDNLLYIPIKVALDEQMFMNEYNLQVIQAQDPSFVPGEADFQPYYTPLFMLNSVDDLGDFTQAVEGLLPAYYTVISAESQFEQVAGPLRSIQGIVTIALIAAVIAALIIISLVVVLFLRDRRKEFGIYLSLGVHKPAIIGQVLIEVFIVAIFALGIALFTGSLISGGFSQELVVNQLNAQQANNGMGGLITTSWVGGDGNLLMGSLSLDDVIASYHVGIDIPYILTFLGLGVGVTVLSCIVPLLYVLRLKPKKILM